MLARPHYAFGTCARAFLRLWFIAAALLPARAASAASPAATEVDQWTLYRTASAQQDRRDREVLDAERKRAGLDRALLAKKGKEFEMPEDPPGGSWQSREALLLAERILSFQTPSGGWAKNVDYSRPRQIGQAYSSDDGRLTQATIDNHATTAQTRFLAQVANATGRADFRAGVERSLQWIFRAQYPNGGWPQFYPLLGKYHDLITFNDDAMVHVLSLLRDAGAGAAPFAFFSQSLKHQATEVFGGGLDCVLAAQICRNGTRTGWCGQYVPQTLQPARGRPFEPAALASAETARMLQFLLQLKSSAELTQAIRAAAAWLKSVELHDLQVTKRPDPSLPKGFDCVITPAVGARGLWARFYEIETNRPVFGDSNGDDHPAMDAVDYSVRVGYDWYVTIPAQVIERLVPAWEKKEEIIQQQSIASPPCGSDSATLRNLDERCGTLVAQLSALLPPETRNAALRTLEQTRPPCLASEVIAHWRVIHPTLRPRVVALLTGNPAYHKRLLEALENTEILPVELNLDTAQWRDLFRRLAPGVAGRFRKISSDRESSNRKSPVKKILTMLPRGETKLDAGFHIFMERCQMCHVRGKYGNRVGPDLGNLFDRSTEDLLSHVLDPNLAIAPEYVPCTVVTKKGDRWTGVLRDETPDSITVILPLATTIVIRREEVASITAAPSSLMPEGLDSGLLPAEIKSLLLFLQSSE